MLHKLGWYLEKIVNLLWVLFNLFFYLIFHPKEMKRFLFPIFSSINEFFQSSHGGLKKFETTALFKKLSSKTIFAKSNLFNQEEHVTRSMETHFLATIVDGYAPKTIFEIGTYNGFTTLHMAVNSPADCKIYTLDLPPGYDLSQAKGNSYDDILVMQLSQDNIAKRFYKKHPLSSKVVELFGDSSKFDFSPYYGKIDLVFIDGNHSTEFVRKDSENAFKLVSENGLIVWHDFDYIIHKDVFTYLKSLSKVHPIYSVLNTRFAIYGKNIH